jgi:CubicO group peptidase (beta-lactamase class C family)
MRNLNLFKTALILFFTYATVYGQKIWPTKEWPASTPEAEGIIKDSLLAFETDITSGKYGYVDGMVIIRNGKLIYQKSWKYDYDKIYGDNAKKASVLNPLDPGGPYNYYNPWWHPFYHRGELHSLQSVSKTITSIIIGIAVSRTEFPDLSKTVLSFFDTSKVKNIDDRKRRMTIQHLLTMTAGFDWNEGTLPYTDPANDCGIMEASFDWVRYVIDEPMAYEPGQTFAYNSGATQILSYIFRKATGKDIEEYAAQNLFTPLGIKDFYWKRTPTGLADTEGGLYLKPSDLAKVFYLWLQNGNWNGSQLVTPDWVKASVAPFITIGTGVKYGYKWWLHEYGGSNQQLAWCGSGFGGQIPVIIPEYNIVAVFTGWNIIQGKPALGTRTILRRLVNSVAEKK